MESKNTASLQSPVEHFLISMLGRGRLSFPIAHSFAQLAVGFLIATDIPIQSVTRTNNYRRQQWITTVGFNHPTLAQRPTVVRDVTVGDHGEQTSTLVGTTSTDRIHQMDSNIPTPEYVAPDNSSGNRPNPVASTLPLARKFQAQSRIFFEAFQIRRLETTPALFGKWLPAAAWAAQILER